MYNAVQVLTLVGAQIHTLMYVKTSSAVFFLSVLPFFLQNDVFFLLLMKPPKILHTIEPCPIV